MPTVAYKCAVNKEHPSREFAVAPSTPPTCCEKPMALASPASNEEAIQLPLPTPSMRSNGKTARKKSKKQGKG